MCSSDLDAYGRSEISPTTAPPRQLPQWAWLRAYYREVVKNDASFLDLDVEAQWEALVQHVVESPAGLEWRELAAVPIRTRAEVLRWLRQTSNLSVRHVLTLRAIAHIGEGPDLQTNRRAFQYEVLGLSSSQQAWIADFGGGWRVLLAIDGESGDWSKPFPGKEDALDALARALEGRDTEAGVLMDIEEVRGTVQLSTNIGTRCRHCAELVGFSDDGDLSQSINHYIDAHGYRLLHLGTQTSHAADGSPWHSTIAVLGHDNPPPDAPKPEVRIVMMDPSE